MDDIFVNSDVMFLSKFKEGFSQNCKIEKISVIRYFECKYFNVAFTLLDTKTCFWCDQAKIVQNTLLCAINMLSSVFLKKYRRDFCLL